jgi:hypothetical protein
MGKFVSSFDGLFPGRGRFSSNQMRVAPDWAANEQWKLSRLLLCFGSAMFFPSGPQHIQAGAVRQFRATGKRPPRLAGVETGARLRGADGDVGQAAQDPVVKA